MAYYSDPNLQDDEDLIQGQGQMLAPQGGTISAGTPGQASSAKTNKPDNPGNFVGINQYLNANKVQSEKLGNQVAGKISSDVQGAGQAVSGLSGQFGNYVNSNVLNPLTSQATQAQGVINKAAGSTAGKAPSAEDQALFGKAATAQYTGPKTALEAKDIYDPISKQVSEAQRLADLSKNEQGSKELVKDFANKDKLYSEGANRLDSYFLNAGGNRGKLATARTGAENLTTGLSEQEAKAAEIAKGAQSQVDASRSNIQKMLESTRLSNLAKTNESLKAKEAEVEKYNKELKSYKKLLGDPGDGSNLTASAEQLARLGIKPGTKLYGALNASAESMIPKETVFDKNTFVNPDEQARLAALDSLAKTYGGSGVNPYTNPDLAGTAKFDPKADLGVGLREEIGKRTKDYTNKYQNEKLEFQLPDDTNFNGMLKGRGKLSLTPNQIEKFLAKTQRPDGSLLIPKSLMREVLGWEKGQEGWLKTSQYVAPYNAKIFRTMLNSWKEKMHNKDVAKKGASL